MQKNWLLHIIHFYIEGFRQMTIGKTLWLIIAIKLVIMFAILRLFFFPNYLNSQSSDMDKHEYVSKELIERSNPIPVLE